MGFEPPKQERKHSGHFSSKRQADELMENTDGFGCTVSAAATRELTGEGNGGDKWKSSKSVIRKRHERAPRVKITLSCC